MSNTVVQLGFGKVTFPNTSASLACFRVKPPFVRDSAATSGRRIPGPSGTFQAGAIPQWGHMYTATVEHQTGTILLLQSGWQRLGASVRDGAIFLRLREGAAKWNIQAKLPLDPQNTLGGEYTVFEGHADVLSGEELEQAGMTPPPFYLNRYMQEEEIDECFIISEVTPQRIPRPGLVQVGEGADARIVEVAAPPQRRINLRKR